MDTPPIARPIDAISHFPTHDQSPGPRHSSVHGLRPHASPPHDNRSIDTTYQPRK